MRQIPPHKMIGIVGGGQLGKMLIHAASQMGYLTAVFCDKEDSPAAAVASHVIFAEYEDTLALKRFVDTCDVVTFEFEQVPRDALKFLQTSQNVRPNPQALFISQNRIREKTWLKSLGIPTAKFEKVSGDQSLKKAASLIGFPCLYKTSEGGYDGRGQFRIEEQKEIEQLLSLLPKKDGVIEDIVDFKKEISIIVARSVQGDCQFFAPAENTHCSGILVSTKAPAELEKNLIDKAEFITKKMMEQLGYVGVLAVEFFVTKENNLLVNEFSPRPHNSGHWTIDACFTSQFEQHVRAICGHPLGNPAWHTRAEMQNVIGHSIDDWKEYLSRPQAKVHLYGKKGVAKGRKMGHITELIL